MNITDQLNEKQLKKRIIKVIKKKLIMKLREKIMLMIKPLSIHPKNLLFSNIKIMKVNKYKNKLEKNKNNKMTLLLTIIKMKLKKMEKILNLIFKSN